MAAVRLYRSSFLSKDLMSRDKDIIRPSRVYAAVKTIIFRVFGWALRSKWYFFVLSSKESTILLSGESVCALANQGEPMFLLRSTYFRCKIMQLSIS